MLSLTQLKLPEGGINAGRAGDVDRHADDDCLQRMCAVISANEEWLLERVVDSVRESGLANAPRSEAGWRESVRGLSDAVFQAVYGVVAGASEGPMRGDPVLAYGVVRARRQHARGVRAADWHALLRHHRSAYVELVATCGFDEDEEEMCTHFLHSVFDRFERGFRQGYTASTTGGGLAHTG